MKKIFWFLGLFFSCLIFGFFIFWAVTNIKHPESLDLVAWSFIYGSLIISVSSFLALTKILFIKIFWRVPIQISHYQDALRQGVLLAILLSIFLILQQNRNLNIINGAVAVLAIVIIEFFLNRK